LKKQKQQPHQTSPLQKQEQRIDTTTPFLPSAVANPIFPASNHDTASDAEGENGDDSDMPPLIQRTTNASDNDDDSDDGGDDEGGDDGNSLTVVKNDEYSKQCKETDLTLDAVNGVHAIFKTIDGVDSSKYGMYGELTQGSLDKVFVSLLQKCVLTTGSTCYDLGGGVNFLDHSDVPIQTVARSSHSGDS
jgi:hypothetical protein